VNPVEEKQDGDPIMKCLVVEDDFAARRLLQILLSEYGLCLVATNGREAVEAFKQALDEDDPYDFICLDIMMPEMDGHQTLKAIRQIEAEHGIQGLDGVKVVMTTALKDPDNVFGAFREGCEAYLVKPVKKVKLIEVMDQLGLMVQGV
jgi:two-component system, chemotaxis family, chemotaxis protein CheY